MAVSECAVMTNRMGALALESMQLALAQFIQYDGSREEQILANEDKLDTYEDRLGGYLVQISQHGTSSADMRTVSRLLHAIGDFERIGDHALNLQESAKELHEKQLAFSPIAREEVDVLTSLLEDLLNSALRSFQSDDPQMARQVEPLEETMDLLTEEIRSRHIRRLQSGQCTIQLGFILNDLLNNAERVGDHCSNIAVSVIEEQEKQALDLSNFGTEERKSSTDASIQYNEEKKEFILVKQVQGTEIDPDKLETTVDTNLNAAFDTALLGDTITIPLNKHVYISPAVTATEDMENKVTSLNSQLKKYRSTTVTYTFGSETVVLDADTISSWLKAEGETLTLDEDAIKTYISDLANKYNTIYVPRTFHTSTGTDVTIEGNEYGYRIDQDGEYAQLVEDLKSGTAVTRDPVYSKTGYQRNGTDDLAGSYIEVSLDAQHLCFIKMETL